MSKTLLWQRNFKTWNILSVYEYIYPFALPSISKVILHVWVSLCTCVERERDRLLQIVVSRIFFYILIEVPKQILNHTFLGLSYFKAWERCFVRTCCDLTQAIFIGIPFFFSIVFQVNKLYFIKHEIINLVRFFFLQLQ